MRAWRRVVSSLNFTIVIAAIAVLFILINFISSRRYARHEFTNQRLTALSERTLQTLKTLKESVSVVVFYQPGHRLYELVSDLLKEYERATPLIRVEYVDPEQDIARARQLVKEFEINPRSQSDLNLVIFKAGTHHKHLTDTDLADYDFSGMGMRMEPSLKAFKGEEAFTSAIVSVTQASQPLIWCISGHGEKALESAELEGLSNLKKALEQQNMSLQTVTLLERSEIPATVGVVVIAGPRRRFAETEVAALESYLETGGKLLALIDPLEDSGLDGLLKRWGVEVGMDVVVDPARQLPFVSAANLIVADYTEHPIVKKMQTLVTLFPLARSMRPAKPTPAGLNVTPLAMTTETGWGETNPTDPHFKFDEGKDLKGPVPIAVAVEGQLTTTQTASRGIPKPARLVVIGDSDFMSNGQLGSVGNRDFALGAVYWLTEQEQRIGIGPKTIESIRLSLTGQQLMGLFVFSFLVFPLTYGALGIVVWWLRRK